VTGIFKNKKGMSLMEILVGSLLFALIAITVTALLAPMMLTFMRANDLAEYNKLLDNVGNIIVSDLSRASEALPASGENNVVITVSTGNTVAYTAPAGSLLRNGVPVFPPGFYKGKTVSFDVSKTAPGYTVTVTVSSAGRPAAVGVSIERDYSVLPLMLIEN